MEPEPPPPSTAVGADGTAPPPASSSSTAPSPPPPPAHLPPHPRSDEDRSPLALLRRALDPTSTAPPPSPTLVRALCRRLGVIPSDLRARAWRALLLPPQQQQQQQQLGAAAGGDVVEELARGLREVALDLPNQRVVEVDALRTRSELPCFRDRPQVQRRVERLLTYYCKANGITYKQGLNEVAAPFIYITLPPSPATPAGGGGEEGDVDDGGSGAEAAEAGADGEAEAVALQCFSRFVRVFLRNMYTDEEFKAMQCAFGLFRLLLLYHSPLLSARLDRAGFPPELYLTPWLLTVFSRTLDMDTTLQLWDQYILEDDPLLHVFVVLAFLRRHEAALLACGEDTLPETISNLRFTGNVEVKALIADGKRLKADTPESYCRRLYRICNHDLSGSELDRLLPAFGDALVLGITPKEALRGVVDHLEFVLDRMGDSRAAGAGAAAAGVGMEADGPDAATAPTATSSSDKRPTTPHTHEEAMTASNSSSSAASVTTASPHAHAALSPSAALLPGVVSSPARPPKPPKLPSPLRPPLASGPPAPPSSPPQQQPGRVQQEEEGEGEGEEGDADESLTRTVNDARLDWSMEEGSTDPVSSAAAAAPAVAGAGVAGGAAASSSDAVCTRALTGSADGLRQRHAFIFCDCRPRHLYDRFRIDSSLHLDPALLPPPSSSADVPQQQGKEKDENEDEELSAFLLALQRAWGGLVHVCIVSDGEGGGAPPSKTRPQATAARFVRAFLARGFARVSYLEGGMEAFVRQLEEELRGCASDDEEGEGEEKDTDEGEGEAPASRRRGVQQGHQDKGAKRRRRELLEAVLAVGPPVRGARAAAAEEEAGGGSKASIFRRLFGGPAAHPARRRGSPSPPKPQKPPHRASASPSRSPPRGGRAQEGQAAGAGALYAALMAGAGPGPEPPRPPSRQGGGRAASPSFPLLPSLSFLGLNRASPTPPAPPAPIPIPNSTSAPPGPPSPDRTTPLPGSSSSSSSASPAAAAAAGGGTAPSPTPFLSRLASRLSQAVVGGGVGMASAAEAAINPYSPLSLASPATDQEAMRLLASAPVVDAREWVEGGGGSAAGSKEFRVYRQLPSGRLSACSLILAPDGRMLLGVEVPGQLGCLRVLEARSLGDLSQVTKKKRAKNAIRLHFDRFAVPSRATTAAMTAAAAPTAAPTEQEQQHVRGLSGSLSSTVTASPMAGQRESEGQEEPKEGPQYDVIELFTTDYMRVVEALKGLVTAATAAADGEQQHQQSS